nr:adhesin [Methanobrevibacter smithii]
MVKKIFAVVGSALLFLLIIGASSAADIDINNDGTFSDVQNGINQARSGDTIYLNNHTFTGSGSEISVAGGWFSNKDKITIDGSINPNKGGTGNEMSTLDAKSSSRVFNIGASSITLKNIIITNGKYSGRDANGAGVYSSGSNLVLENCVISNCEASSSSRGDVHSALYSENTVTLSRCTLVNNKATSTYNTVTNSYVVRTASFDGSMTDCIVRDNYVSSIGAMAIGITIVGSSSNKVSNTKFMNNYATSTNGNAFGAALQVLGTVSNCTFEYNQANSDVNNSHAGALCFRPESTVYNCTFIGNIAYRGAATTFHASGELKDCIFINNTATGFGGAISTGYDGTTGQKVKISNSYFEGNAAPIGGAITTHGNDITVDNSTFISNKAADDGGAVYVVDDGITVLNSNFGNNSAKNHAGAIYVKGNNVKIQNATFVNNSAHFAGAVRVEGNYVNVLNATFIGNKAISDGVSKSQAGALGISGNNVNIDSSYFVNNTVEGDAGAIGVKGSHIKVTNSQFYSNHANPFNNDLNTGLGGAIYTMGNNVTYDNAIFRYNTAVNGSALFVDGVASLKNIVFYRNQAYTYALPIIVQNPKNPYGVTVNVTVVIIGGNNIANAIHHVGQLNDISFDNVTYLFNVNGTIMNRTTGADEIHPVDGVENSKNGTLIYRDERENTQSINPIVIYNEDGNIIYNETLISSIYGDVRFSLSGLAPGNYTIKAEHPEDLFYKAIKNETNFEVVGFVDLDVNITTDKDYYGLDEEVEWTISLTNHGPHTDNYCYVNGIKLDDIVGFTSSKGTFDAATGVWNVGKLAKNEVVTLKVKTKTTSLGTITLTVNAVNSTEDTNISNNVATKTIYIQEQPKVVPTKDVNVTNPNYGDKVKYTIVISNVGKIAADVTLRDILDEGLIFAGASGNYEYDSTTRTITWNIGDLPVGQNLTFYVYATVNAYGVLNNTVAVGDNTFIRNVTVPEITPDKTIDNDSPNFGDKVSYTVTVTNGEFEANNVIVKDVVGNGLTVTDISDNGQYDPITRTITWIVDLAKNEVKTFTVEATVSGYGNISNKVVVGNKTIFKNVDVPEITPKKDVNNTTPNFGENVAYTIVVSNDGISDAKQVVITDTLAKGLKFLGANYNGVYDENTHTVTWTLDIDSGKTVELKVNVTVEDYGVLVNRVTVGDKTSSVDIAVPEIIPDKTANVTDANFGDNVTYTVTVTNDGDVDASQVVIVDQLGNGLKYVSSSDGGVWDEKTNTVTWIVDLAAGKTKTLNVVATVVGYGNVTNSLAVGNKTSKINVNVPEITPNKTVDNKNPNFGDNVTYTIVVSNDGAADAKNVVVKDILAPGFKFIEANYGGVYDELTRTVTWIVDVNAKDHVDLTIKVTVEDYGVLTNNVTVGNKTSSVNITVPEIIPNKTADIENPNFGDEVTYTVNVTNAGKVNANNVVVHDVLGEGLELISADGGVYDDKTRTITWTVNLNSGETKSFKVVAKVIGYGDVTNSLVVGNKTSAVDVNVPEIIPGKDANNKAPNFGDSIDYTITVNNIGKADAKNVVVVDHLAKGLKYISSSDNGVYDAATHTVTWVIDIAADSSFDLTVTAVADEYGVLTNIVSVGDKSASVDVNVPEIIPNKTADIENPNFGDNVTYTVTVTNDGNADAKAVVVRDVLGKDLKFVSATGTYTFDEATNTITWTVDVDAGKTETFTVVATVINYGNVTNSLVVGNKTFNKNVTVPEITPDKTVDNENPNFGDNLTYTVTVKNEGNGNATDVIIVDTLGKGLEYVSSTGNYDNKTNTITWKVNLASGETKTFTVVAKIVGYTDVTNKVTVGNKTAAVTVNIPEIIPAKDVNNTTPNFGDTVEYTITVNNNANKDAKQVVIVDTLGKGLKFINASHNGKYDESTRTITWIIDLDAGESAVFSVNAAVEAYGNINNTVVVGNKSFTKNITVPEITPIKKVENTVPNFGEEVTYFISVFNSAIVDAKQVVVVDHLDKGLKYVSSSHNGVYDEVAHTVTWVVDIGAGSSFDLTVTAVADEYGVLTNDVTVGDKRASVDVTVPEIIPAKSVDVENPNFNDEITYTVTVTNNGVVDAKQVVVRDVLGEGLKFVKATGEYTFDEATNTVTWIVDLAKGESQTFYVTAVSEAYGVLSNNVFVGDKIASAVVTVPEIIPGKSVDVENPNFGDTVTYTVVVTNNGVVDAKQVVVVDHLNKGLKYVSSSHNGVYDEAAHTVTWVVDIAAGSSLDLTVTAVADEYGVLTNDVTVGDKTASVDVTVPEIIPTKDVNNTAPNFGDKVEYTITLSNNGVVDAKQVVVVDTLDEGLTFVSASDNGVWNPFKRTVTWTVDLAKGESKVFTVIATVSAYGNIPNTVSVGDKSSSVNIAVPEIIPGKTVDVENPNFGDTVTYTVVVTNNGVVDAKQVVVRDILDKGLKFVKATGEYTFDEDSRTVTWIIDLAKGESQTFYVTAVAEAYGVLTNDVTVGDKTASADVVVPEIIPDKTANITNPNFGDKVDYTVTVTNDGIGDANNVVIVDRLGEGLIFVSASDNGVWDPVKRTVTWIVDLAKGESKVFSVIATVVSYGNVTNSLVVGNKTAGVNVTVPEIIPDKTANISNPNFGDNVNYTVTVTNDGIGDAKDVVVRDILGEGLTFVDATGNYTFDEVTRTITWIVDLAKGESRTFYVNAIVSGYGNVTNSLVVGNKTAGVNVTVPEIIPDKTVNISNPNFGDNVNYTVTVTNDGIGDAKDVVVRDVLGEGLKFVSATGNYTFDEVTRTVTWIVDLAKGESKVFSVIAIVSGYGNVTNSLVVGNKTTGVNVTVPEIIPDKTVDNEIPNFGDNVTYTVTVTNDGIGDANNVVITDVLDKGLKFLNATGNFTYDEKTGTITWTVDLAKGETKTFNVNVTVLGYGVLSNTVVVGNKTAVRNITVPEIITVKEVNSSDIHIGDEITYTITVSNSGKINATNVVIRDILPEGLKFINASNGGVYDPVTGIITWILNITANSTVDLTVDVCVNKSGNITNTVNVGNKTSNCTIESGDIVDLEIHIVADKSEIYVGDNIVYTVTVINNGPSDAINTIANILIPNALSIFSYNATKGTFDITSGNWSIGNLTNGEKVVLTFVAKALNEGNSTVYVNVTSETFEVIMENNYDNVTVKVLKKAAPIGPDKQVHPDGSSSDNECGKSVNLPNTGNPLVMLLLCILSVIFVGSRKRKL